MRKLFKLFNKKGFSGTYTPDDKYNQFHQDDTEKAECLSLETRIKATIINWRRLHDDVELDWEKGDCHKTFLVYDSSYDEVSIFETSVFVGEMFGYFSSKEKAQQFYEYMKDDIDRYFKMRKELKF
jgi:hypothetical protein